MLLSERRAFWAPTPTPNPSEIVRFDSVGASQMSDRKLKGYACAHVLPRCRVRQLRAPTTVKGILRWQTHEHCAVSGGCIFSSSPVLLPSLYEIEFFEIRYGICFNFPEKNVYVMNVHHWKTDRTSDCAGGFPLNSFVPAHGSKDTKQHVEPLVAVHCESYMNKKET